MFDQALEALDFDLGIDETCSYPYDEVSDPSDELYTAPFKIRRGGFGNWDHKTNKLKTA